MAPDSGSSTLNPNNDAAITTEEPTDDKRNVRSIPPWVQLRDELDRAGHDEPLLRPETPVVPNHHYLPAPQQDRPRGRKWDYIRDAEPALLDQTLVESSARWMPYMLSGPQPNSRDVEGARLMSDDWMQENMPWWTDAERMSEDDHGEKGRLAWLRRTSVTNTRRTILKNPYIPLIFRLFVITFTLAALGLGVRVFHQTHRKNNDLGENACVQRASTYMAIILDCIAVPYIFYVTWDEYTSKPLGLRSATAKTALLLIDLYFIVFYASNLSLAFDALTDGRWACYPSHSEGTTTCPKDSRICHSQSGLVAVLLVALAAWLVTFSISVLRVVSRLRPDE